MRRRPKVRRFATQPPRRVVPVNNAGIGSIREPFTRDSLIGPSTRPEYGKGKFYRRVRLTDEELEKLCSQGEFSRFTSLGSFIVTERQKTILAKYGYSLNYGEQIQIPRKAGDL